MSKALKPLPGFKFGCDPELFVLNPDGKLVSAHDLLPGTKEDPYKVPFGAIQVDGTAAEFNIDPVETYEDWERNITSVLKTLLEMLPKKYKLSIVPSVVFDKDEWKRIPDSAKELGCMPDFNAWTGDVNPSPRPAQEGLRTASGHLHIGWTEGVDLSVDIQHIGHCNDLVKQLDWYLGYWSLQPDPDSTRRTLYGQAGACRYKSYGVEYRVLSNFWLTSQTRRLAVWNRMQQAILDMSTRFIPDKSSNNNSQLITSINTSRRMRELESYRSYPLTTINEG